MYRVTVEQQPTQREADIEAGLTHVLTARIEPPVSLTQEAVQSFMVYGTLERSHEGDIEDAELADVMLVGSTHEATVIHAYLNADETSEGRQLMGDRCVGLLRVMGAEAEFVS